MALTAEERKDRAQRRRATKQAISKQHQLQVFAAEVEHPLTRLVAHALCRCIYPANGCACEKRPDLPDCSSMSLAALQAIRLVRQSRW
jgi:hypothetical protein